MDETPLLSIEDLAVSFPPDDDGADRVRAVNGVDLAVYPRQTLAVVGESGSGKSVTALSVLRLLDAPPARYDAGSIELRSPDGGGSEDLLAVPEKRLRSVRGDDMAMIFQEPMTSLNPVYTVGEQILEAIRLHRSVPRREALALARRALGDVGIADPEARLRAYPHQLSGGMRQRVMIAMALACRPRLLIADEPTTALDVTIEAQILELLSRLQHEQGMAVVLITHDLGVVAQNADAVAVMYAGRVVECGSVPAVFARPMHPYTQGLFAAMPVIGRTTRRLATIPGGVPSPSRLPPGCPFHPRCHAMEGDPQCRDAHPPLREVGDAHWAACWHAPGHEAAPATIPRVAHRRERAAPARGPS